MFQKVIFLVCLFAFSGCAVKQYQFIAESTPAKISEPSQEMAQVVFLRPSKGVMGAFNSIIIDVTQPEHKILGVAPAISKFAVDVKPGKHTLFSTHGLQGHVMNMEVEAGKRYYVLVRPIYGNGFQLRPIKHDTNNEFGFNNPEFDNWVTDTKLVSKGLGAEEWYTDFNEKNLKLLAKAQKVWDEKNDEQRFQLTLLPEDAN